MSQSKTFWCYPLILIVTIVWCWCGTFEGAEAKVSSLLSSTCAVSHQSFLRTSAPLPWFPTHLRINFSFQKRSKTWDPIPTRCLSHSISKQWLLPPMTGHRPHRCPHSIRNELHPEGETYWGCKAKDVKVLVWRSCPICRPSCSTPLHAPSGWLGE